MKDVKRALAVAYLQAERVARAGVEQRYPEPPVVPAPQQLNLDAVGDTTVQLTCRCEEFGAHGLALDRARVRN